MLSYNFPSSLNFQRPLLGSRVSYRKIPRSGIKPPFAFLGIPPEHKSAQSDDFTSREPQAIALGLGSYTQNPPVREVGPFAKACKYHSLLAYRKGIVDSR